LWLLHKLHNWHLLSVPLKSFRLADSRIQKGLVEGHLPANKDELFEVNSEIERAHLVACHVFCLHACWVCAVQVDQRFALEFFTAG
jgi:hypothetical protein